MPIEIENYALIIIPLCMWIIAQVIKFIIFSTKHGIDWKYLFEYGHLPSSHASCMSSMVFAFGYYQGVDSPLFAIASIVALLTLYDAVKLRAYIGEYGKALNLLIKDIGTSKKGYPQLKERVGHTLTEVLSGIFLGTVGSFTIIQILQKIN